MAAASPSLRDLIQAVLDRTPEEQKRTGDLADELLATLQPEIEDHIDTAIAKHILDQGGENTPLDQVLRENALCGCADADRTYAEMEAHHLAEIERLQDLTSRLRADYRAEIAEAETQIRELNTQLAARDTVKEERDQLKKLTEEALHLRMYGERAPGGNENWHDWDTKTDRALRAMLDQQTTTEET